MDSHALSGRRAGRMRKYRRHRASNRALVVLNGQTLYLGTWNSTASRAEYAALISQSAANDGTLPQANAELTVVDVIARFNVSVASMASWSGW